MSLLVHISSFAALFASIFVMFPVWLLISETINKVFSLKSHYIPTHLIVAAIPAMLLISLGMHKEKIKHLFPHHGEKIDTFFQYGVFSAAVFGFLYFLFFVIKKNNK